MSEADIRTGALTFMRTQKDIDNREAGAAMLLVMEDDFQRDPGALTLYVRDPGIVDLLEWSSYEGLTEECLSWPARCMMIHFPKNMKLGGQPLGSMLAIRIGAGGNQINVGFRSLSEESGLEFARPPLITDAAPADTLLKGWTMAMSVPGGEASMDRLYWCFSDEATSEVLRGNPVLKSDGSVEMDESAVTHDKAILRFLTGIGIYHKAYPEAFVAGVPDNAHEPAPDITSPNMTMTLPKGLREAVEERRAGVRSGKVSPHARRWCWRRLPDDPVRYPNKHGQVVFVKACVVGRVKTVVDITEPTKAA